MKQTPDPDWVDLGRAWQEQEADLGLSAEELQARLRRQRIMTTVLMVGELLSLAVVLGVASWMSRLWLTTPGGSPILIIFLLLPTCVVLWLRWRQRAGQEADGLEGIDATIQREERLLELMRLGSVMSQLALVAFIIATAFTSLAPVLVHLVRQDRITVVNIGSVASVALLLLYVYGLQIALIVWGRRVRRRRKRLEAVRRALQPKLPE